VGGRREEAVGASLVVGERTLTVYGRLALTGVGPFDRSVFVAFETADALAAAGRRTAGASVFAGGGRVSAVLVRLTAGATADQVRFALAGEPGVKVVAAAPIATSVRQALTAILGATVALAVLVVAASVLMVGAHYSAALVERRRELGLLLALGMRPAGVLRLILVEACLVTGAGGIGGLVVGGAALLAVQRSLGHAFEQLAVPFVWPGPAALAGSVVAALALATAVGPAGALVPAWRAIRRDPDELLRAPEG
jgi:putative ABC transport system permease protein